MSRWRFQIRHSRKPFWNLPLPEPARFVKYFVRCRPRVMDKKQLISLITSLYTFIPRVLLCLRSLVIIIIIVKTWTWQKIHLTSTETIAPATETIASTTDRAASLFVLITIKLSLITKMLSSQSNRKRKHALSQFYLCFTKS